MGSLVDLGPRTRERLGRGPLTAQNPVDGLCTCLGREVGRLHIPLQKLGTCTAYKGFVTRMLWIPATETKMAVLSRKCAPVGLDDALSYHFVVVVVYISQLCEGK